MNEELLEKIKGKNKPFVSGYLQMNMEEALYRRNSPLLCRCRGFLDLEMAFLE